MKLATVCAFLLSASALATPSPPKSQTQSVSYDGVKVLRIQLDDSTAKAAKVEALIKKLNLETWTDAVKPNHNVDVQVGSADLAKFQSGLAGIPYTTMHEDLGASIRAESETIPISALSKAVADDVTVQATADMSWFNTYHSYADHLTYISQLATQFSGNAKVVTAGSSYEGRPITGLHIFGSSGGGTKPAVIFHGTVHAREWITTMVTEFMAYSLLSNYANSTEIKAYVDKYDFYIFPVVNPDGFVYTQTNTRLWRKNRVPGSGGCYGTDINRNWNAGWALTGGASTDPCAETYKGPSAASAPETQGLAAFQNSKKASQGVKFYMDFHSYSQLWMSPYGYTCSALPADNTELNRVSKGAVAALKAVYGTTYSYGPICQTIYQATGGSVDYSYDVTGVKYSYTAELRDTGSYGFVLPASQIYVSGVETWAAIKYTLANMV